MTFNADEWHKTMKKNYGQGWKDELRSRAKLGGAAKVSKGLGKLTPERRAEISALGVAARRTKYVNQPTAE